MLYRSLFPRDVFPDLDRLQHEVQSLLDGSPSIRGRGRGGYPAVNVGSTPQSVEVMVFAPGMDANQFDVNLDRGVLTIAGERPNALPTSDDKIALHSQERFSGRFSRVINLPDDIDPNAVAASYRDGVLHVSVKRRESAQPRRITVQ